MRLLATIALALTLAGCAGRSPEPVAMMQPTDQYMDCAAISLEAQANNAKVQKLASDQGMKTSQNVAAGVAGIFVPILWFGMDFQDTADKETVALQNRQQYLATMAAQRRCGEPAAPPAPAPHRAAKHRAAK